MKENVIEVNKAIRKMEKDNKIKNTVILGTGFAIAAGALIYFAIKMKEKLGEHAYDTYDYGDWEDYDDTEFEDDYSDYEDFEDFEDSEGDYEEYEEE
ncbi:MAG: hypothetical protein IJS61_11115 [Firmicutes bacterium]|nr:hypothetical protein [Bacillota bacterium]